MYHLNDSYWGFSYTERKDTYLWLSLELEKLWDRKGVDEIQALTGLSDPAHRQGLLNWPDDVAASYWRRGRRTSGDMK